jgi:imidazolonepropionase-like amidohydrolase
MTLSVRLAGAAVLGVLAAVPVAAQRAAPTTWAITGARLVPVSGPPIAAGTLVVREGRIAALGAGVRAPADARIIDGTGLTIYPGLIDAAGALGQRAAAGGEGGGGAAATGTATRPAGLRPETDVLDALVTDAFDGPHGAGITAALTAPTGGLFQGRSAVIALRSDEAATMVVRAPVALHVAFQGVRGAFPGSLLGVFAEFRQQLLDARRYGAMQAAAAANPRGTARPAFDASMEALQPVLAGTMPVAFNASSEREIHRALDLATEFRLQAMIVGGQEAWKIADRLRAMNVPVIQSLNFPKKPTNVAADADPEPVRVLRTRVEAPAGPAKLAAAGVRMAFASGGASWGDHLGNLRATVTNGLAADAALRAHTLGAAELLGVADRLGSLEVGKVANLTVVRGDLFSDSAKVTHVFVDGTPRTLDAARPAAAGRGPGAGAARATTLTGTWTTTVALEEKEYAITLQLTQVEAKLTGTMQGALGTAEITQGELTGEGEFRFTAPVTVREGTEEGIFVGVLTGNAVRGGLSIVGHALGRFSGTRPNPAGDAPSGAGRARPSTTP